jgi:hypothetical protein
MREAAQEELDTVGKKGKENRKMIGKKNADMWAFSEKFPLQFYYWLCSAPSEFKPVKHV